MGLKYQALADPVFGEPRHLIASTATQPMQKAVRAQSLPSTKSDSLNTFRVILLSFTLAFLFNLTLVIIHQKRLFANTSGIMSERVEHLWGLDFSTVQEPPHETLEQLGFSLEKEMADKEKITLTAMEDRLEISAQVPAFGLMVLKNIHLEDPDTIEIEWGINKYPEGADWDNEVNREAVMVYLFFGESMDSGTFYLPDSPRFLGLFLCKDERHMIPYLGRHFRDTGKYICMGEPAQGETVKTTFNFHQAFRELFNTDEMPPVTGIGIEVDTSGLPDGRSSAFIKYIGLFRTEE